MSKHSPRARLLLEVLLMVVVLATAILFARMGAYRMLALNLFFLPVIVSGYFLGRFSAGILALLSSLSVVIMTVLSPGPSLGAHDSAITLGLALTLWSAVLGLAAILIGSLCDERAATVAELQRAYVGIAEVLARYLHGSDPKSDTPVGRIAKLSEQIARELDLPSKQVDDIRVAALLHDLDNVEITTQLISRAVTALDS